MTSSPEETALSEKHLSPDEALQQEFNRWAEAGEGPKMEQHHLDITDEDAATHGSSPRRTRAGSWLRLRMGHAPSRALGQRRTGRVRPGDWPRRFRRNGPTGARGLERIRKHHLRAGIGQQIPWEENFFDKVLSVESFYYYPDQDRALMELFRVMAPKGRLYILINLVQRQSVLAAVGRQAEGSGSCPVSGGIRGSAQSACVRESRVRSKFQMTRRPRTTTRQNRFIVDRRSAGVQEGRCVTSDGVEARLADACPRATRFIELFRAHWQGMADACISVPLHSQRSLALSD